MKRRPLVYICFMVIGILSFPLGCGTPLISRSPKPMVIVYNGCNTYCSKVGVNGLAREVNKLLVENAYIVGEPQNLSNYKVITDIVYNPSDEKAAKEIREIIRAGRLIVQSEAALGSIQVILGMDAVVPSFPTLKVVTKILILNSTSKKGLGKDLMPKIDHNLTKKCPFYTPDNADRLYYESVVYYPPAEEKLAEEAFAAIGVGRIEAVENLKDVVVVMGIEFAPRTKERMGLLDDKPEVKIVIDKTDFILHVYDAGTGQVIAAYPVSIGENPDLADKEDEEDRRTPEGIFTIVSVEDSSGWIADGERAFGPWFLRLEAPPWTGFGIQGTNEPEKIGMPASFGNVRLRSDDIEKLIGLVGVGTTVEIRQ